MTNVTVVDYGAGNLLNVVRALEHCGANVLVTNKAEIISRAERLVFPGVGAFGDCMKAIKALGIEQSLVDYVKSDRLFLGICVGMQVMFEISEEFGEHKGLGIISGRVVRIPEMGTNNQTHKVPHIGWKELQSESPWQDTMLEDVNQKSAVYFVHSYMGVPTDDNDRLASVDYNGISICAAIRKGNCYGTQFHPEKSGETGLGILRRFLTLG